MNKKCYSLILAFTFSLPYMLKPYTAEASSALRPFAPLKQPTQQMYNEEINIEGELDSNEKKDNGLPSWFTKKSRFFNGTSHSTLERNWFFQPKKDGTPSGEPPEVIELLKKHSGYYLGDTSKKVLYLTFDEGYENGYSEKILDALKSNNVKAAFFATTDYLKRNQDIVKRMVSEGHLVCNHSTTHPSMAQVAAKDKTKFENEFSKCEKTFEEITEAKMPKFFRPPMGKYSELSLAYTKELGYKTIFWSFAYKDWIPESQPSIEGAKKIIMERTHNGGIILLHAVSKTNATIMDSILKEWKSKGFEFKTLNDLP